jgi:hypothetical protein
MLMSSQQGRFYGESRAANVMPGRHSTSQQSCLRKMTSDSDCVAFFESNQKNGTSLALLFVQWNNDGFLSWQTIKTKPLKAKKNPKANSR